MLVMFKTNALPTVLLLQPLEDILAGRKPQMDSWAHVEYFQERITPNQALLIAPAEQLWPKIKGKKISILLSYSNSMSR